MNKFQNEAESMAWVAFARAAMQAHPNATPEQIAKQADEALAAHRERAAESRS